MRHGLSHFSHTSRAAVLYAHMPDSSLRVFDPQFLLQGHELKLRKFFLENGRQRDDASTAADFEPVREENLHLAGLISFAAKSQNMHYQRWFTEHHPDMCSVGPTQCWLEHAAWVFSQAACKEGRLDVDTAGHILREWASHAVRDYIVDTRNERIGWDTALRIYPILDSMLGVSKTLEEGSRAMGDLIFVEPASMNQVKFLAEFPYLEQPTLERYKHVRKLLTAVEGSSRMLVSNGRNILGIAAPPAPVHSLLAQFRGTHGFLGMDGELICSFQDGSFHSSTRRAVLAHVEEALLAPHLDPLLSHQLFKTIKMLVHSAQENRHGCTLVLDLHHQPVPLAGQKLVTPLDLNRANELALAVSLSRLDGALHIGQDMKLHGFACLLDGRSVPSEDRARGARFNSALRFSAEHEQVMVIVVSSDRPVSVIQGGLEMTAQCMWKPMAWGAKEPPLLSDWLQAAT